MSTYDENNERVQVTIRVSIICAVLLALAMVGFGTNLSKGDYVNKRDYMIECSKVHEPTACAAGWKVAKSNN